MSEIFSKLWTLYQAKPAQVTVLSSGALHVDAVRLLSTAEAQKQIDALKDFPVHVVGAQIVTSGAVAPVQWPVRGHDPVLAEPPEANSR